MVELFKEQLRDGAMLGYEWFVRDVLGMGAGFPSPRTSPTEAYSYFPLQRGTRFRDGQGGQRTRIGVVFAAEAGRAEIEETSGLNYYRHLGIFSSRRDKLS
jgi:hypothetical protein